MKIEDQRADVKLYDELQDTKEELINQISQVEDSLSKDGHYGHHLCGQFSHDALQNGLISYLQKLKDVADKQIAAMEEPEPKANTPDPLIRGYRHKNDNAYFEIEKDSDTKMYRQVVGHRVCMSNLTGAFVIERVFSGLWIPSDDYALDAEPEVDPLCGKYSHKGNVNVEVINEVNEYDEFKTLFNGECGSGHRWVPRKEIEAGIKDSTWKRDAEPEDELVGEYTVENNLDNLLVKTGNSVRIYGKQPSGFYRAIGDTGTEIRYSEEAVRALIALKIWVAKL